MTDDPKLPLNWPEDLPLPTRKDAERTIQAIEAQFQEEMKKLEKEIGPLTWEELQTWVTA